MRNVHPRHGYLLRQESPLKIKLKLFFLNVVPDDPKLKLIFVSPMIVFLIMVWFPRSSFIDKGYVDSKVLL